MNCKNTMQNEITFSEPMDGNEITFSEPLAGCCTNLCSQLDPTYAMDLRLSLRNAHPVNGGDPETYYQLFHERMLHKYGEAPAVAESKTDALIIAAKTLAASMEEDGLPGQEVAPGKDVKMQRQKMKAAKEILQERGIVRMSEWREDASFNSFLPRGHPKYLPRGHFNNKQVALKK